MSADAMQKSGSDAHQAILELFESLPDCDLIRLGARIELDRVENRFGLPHEAVMALLRPFLAAVRAPRVFTPERIVCVPFEDLLTIPDPECAKPGEIGRPSISVFLEWLAKELLADSFPPLADRFVQAQRAGDLAATRRAAREIWSICAESMQAAFDDAEQDARRRAALCSRLGGEAQFTQAANMMKVLRIARYIETIKEILPPKPIVALSSEHVSAITDTYVHVADEEPGCELLFLLVVMARLLQPFPILKVFRTLSSNKDDSFVRRTDLSIAGDMVIDALEQDANRVAEAIKRADVSEQEVVRQAARFAAAFKGISTDIGIRRDGAWGQRMVNSRAMVSDAVGKIVLDCAEETVKTALPVKDGRLGALSQYPDDSAFEAAENRAIALAQTLRISEQLGLKTACGSAVSGLRRDFDDLGVQMIKKLAAVDPEREAPAHANLCMVVRLTELIANSEQADLLRRRGTAALKEAVGKADRAET